MAIGEFRFFSVDSPVAMVESRSLGPQKRRPHRSFLNAVAMPSIEEDPTDTGTVYTAPINPIPTRRHQNAITHRGGGKYQIEIGRADNRKRPYQYSKRQNKPRLFYLFSPFSLIVKLNFSITFASSTSNQSNRHAASESARPHPREKAVNDPALAAYTSRPEQSKGVLAYHSGQPIHRRGCASNGRQLIHSSARAMGFL